MDRRDLCTKNFQDFAERVRSISTFIDSLAPRSVIIKMRRNEVMVSGAGMRAVIDPPLQPV